MPFVFYIKNGIIKDLPKELSKEELDELVNHGIQRMEIAKNYDKISYSDKIFMTSILNSSLELYFYRTNHAWYWTNKINETSENEKFKIKNLKKCKWRIIKLIEEEEEEDDDDDINYNGISHSNKVIITFLRYSGLKYLID